ncbi:hypothetical protein [Tunicatimonas pelagia]|uniref:hypothetical protein n=1 Tax=Tunicatimonas pelagia TaxID=931531 RepID=UPI0026652623|nr:hypothetical protein [Tunicatimonas pelagia]WKN43238.1 hypothetical protein P0M28_29790 [Tunicatimonas pelagia]
MKNSIYVSLVCGALLSCQDDVDTNNFGLPASVVQFSITEASSLEGSGFQQVRVYLDEPQEGNTLVSFSVSGNVTFATNTQRGDVRLLTESPLLIPPGETEAFIDFELLEDFDFESEPEALSITLTGILEGNALLSTTASERIYQHRVEENEYELNLRWDQQTSSDMDLVVELPNSRVLISDNTNGFEQVVIGNVDQNTSYLVSVWYLEGSEPINYEVSYQKAGSEVQILQQGQFEEDEANEEFSLANGNGTHQYKLLRSNAELTLIPR